MRLINTATLQIQEFIDEDMIPPYAILSHRWGSEEVTLQEMNHPNTVNKSGYDKIQRGCHLALEAGITHFWADTCCIDKTSSAELSEAINSMYRWYENAKVCYVYLVDVDDVQYLYESDWFTRGWTLQELLAPADVLFFDKHWRFIGEKKALAHQISERTGIPTSTLKGKSSRNSIAQRMSWAAKRATTRKEDMAYSLMGLFDVNMPLLYGEGGEKAFLRLQEEIIRRAEDMSIFAWTRPEIFDIRTIEGNVLGHGLLAPNISCFEHCGDVRLRRGLEDDGEEIMITNRGISVSLRLQAFAFDVFAASLGCMIGADVVSIFLSRTTEVEQQFTRVSVKGKDRICLPYETVYKNSWVQPRRLRVLSKFSPLLQMRRLNCRDVVVNMYSGKALGDAPFRTSHLPVTFTNGNRLIGCAETSGHFPFEYVTVAVDRFLNPVLILTNGQGVIERLNLNYLTPIEFEYRKPMPTDWERTGVLILPWRYEMKIKALNLHVRSMYVDAKYYEGLDKTIGPALKFDLYPSTAYRRFKSLGAYH